MRAFRYLTQYFTRLAWVSAVAALVFAWFSPALAGRQQPSNLVRAAASREDFLILRIEAVPADPSAYFQLAELQEKFGAFAEAEATLLQARRAMATNKEVVLELAAFYRRRDNFEKVVAMFQAASVLEPANAELQVSLGSAFADWASNPDVLPPERLRRVRAGIAAVDRALALAAGHTRAISTKAVLLTLQAESITEPADKRRIFAEAAALMRQADGVVEGPPVEVGGSLKPPVKIKDVRPVYPADAVAARIEGIVLIEATINPAGTVADMKILRSVPMLDQAALDAVRQWVYEPTILGDRAVSVIMTVTLNFALQ